MLFGNEETGCELKTSLCGHMSVEYMIKLGWSICYPTSMRIQKSPEYSIFPDFRQPTTSVKERRQHAFAVIYNSLVLLRFSGLRSIICHSMFLWNRRYYECWMQADQGLSE